MKKMKFTLGLALSMLILGASIANAQSSVPVTVSHGGNIAISATVKGCNFFVSPITVQGVYFDRPTASYIGYGQGTVGSITFSAPDINDENTILTSTAYNWPYGSRVWNASGNSWRWGSTGSIMYFAVKPDADVYNKIVVKLSGVKGLDLRPTVKKIVTFGSWNDNFGTLSSAGSPNPPYALREDSVWFEPIMDRETGVYTFIFKDHLISSWNEVVFPIFSIQYVITANDAFGDPADNEYQPPIGSDVVTPYKLQFYAEEGIDVIDPYQYGTMPVSYGLDFFWPSLTDFAVTVASATPVTVTTDPVRYETKWGVLVPIEDKVFNNLDGTYTVIVPKINQVMKIYLSNGTSTAGDETGNATIAADNVWSAAGTIFVEAAKPGTLAIYTVTGQLLQQTPVNGSFSIGLPKGLYIVQLNGKAYKIIN